MDSVSNIEKQNTLYYWALILAFLTVVYNILEGLIATYFGLKDETLTLFGFGADSFVETISAIGVTHMVIRIKKRGLGSAFTVRKISNGVGVERTFQTHSPLIGSIKVKRKGDVRQAKLYYLRELTGKAARIKEKLDN